MDTHPTDSGVTLPLTQAQTRVWLDEQLSTSRLAYTMGDCLLVTGPLDERLYAAALQILLAEGECLRATFHDRDGVPYQIISEDAEIPVSTVDLTADPDPIGRARAAMTADLGAPFDLSVAPLARAVIFRIGPERFACYLAMHHIVCDGYSRVTLYRRLAEIYRAMVDGRPVSGEPLPPLQVLLDSQLSYQSSRHRDIDGRYWSRQLAALRPAGSLSGRTVTAATALLRRTRLVDPATAARWRQAAERYDVSWPTFALAATAGWLAKCIGRSDVSLTLPVTARVGAAARRTPGMVANYLPLPVGVPPTMTVRGLVDQLSADVAGSLMHQRFRLEESAKSADYPAGRQPFGPFVNVLPQSPVIELGPCRAELQNLSTGLVDDLMVTVLDGVDDTIELHLNGNPALYDASEIELHARRLAGFISDFAAADGDLPVAQLGVLDAGERAELNALGTGPQRSTEYRGVVERFGEQVRRRPGAIAVVDHAGSLTYRELMVGVQRLARRLPIGGLVGMLITPGRDAAITMLAALQVGGAWLSLDPNAPLSRLTDLLAQASLDVLVVDESTRGIGEAALAARVTGTPLIDVLLASDGTSMAEKDVSVDIQARDRAGDLAYVLFTSGTTGRPKGAMVHRGGLVNHLLSKVDVLDLSDVDTVVQNAPITFDVAIWQMLAPLIIGGSVRYVNYETAADPALLAAVVERENVTVLEVVPSLLRAALELWSQDSVEFASLRCLMVTGEALPAQLCRRWFERFPRIPLVNAYGPTECSDDVAHAVIHSAAGLGNRTPIGVPIGHIKLTVLGDDLQPVARGAIGELYVSGAGVGLGYLGAPGRTAVTFVADPAGSTGERMYRTGDQVRWRGDGSLEFVERRDNQVKVRGHRIELGEVETAISRIDGVAQAVVIAETSPSGTVLHAYVVPANAGSDVQQVRAEVERLLPAHLVPQRWSMRAQIPLTAHGKVDRVAIVTPKDAAPKIFSTDARSTAPSPSDTATLICKAFGAVLGLTDARPDDSFFALGGDSIGSIQLVARARRDGLRFTAADVFEHRTPAALAVVCEQSRIESVCRTSTGADATDHGVVELSISAADLAEVTQEANGPAARYGQYVVVHLPNSAPTGGIQLALQALLDTHEMLRAQVEQVAPGVWITRTRAVGTVQAAERLVEVAAVDGGSAARQRQLQLELDRATALLSPTAGQVFRAVLLRGNGDRLLLLCHHLVVDGVSWRILLDDLRQAWQQNSDSMVLDEVPTSFRRWTATVGELARSADRITELPDWLWSVKRTGPIRVVSTEPSARGTYGDSESLRFDLGPATAEPLLGSVPRAFGVAINDVLLGSLGLAIAEWSRRRAGAAATAPLPLIEVEGHGRESLGNLDLSRTVGWFTTMFPFVAATESSAPLQSMTPTEIRRSLTLLAQQRGSLADHGMGWGMLRYLNAQTRPLLQNVAVPEVGFNYLGRFAVSTADRMNVDTLAEPWALDSRDLPDGVAIGTSTDPAMPLRHAVAVTASTQDGPEGPSLVMSWRWSPGLLGRPDVADLARTWLQALEIVTRAARAATDVELAATAIQRGLIFQSHLDDEGRDLYVIQLDADLDGAVDADRLRAAVSGLLDRHPMLRAGSGFDQEARPVLRIGAGRPDLPWFEHDLTDLDPAAQESAIATIAEDDRVRRFDLTRPPLIRCQLVRLARNRFRFVWTLHHLLVDGWSMGVLVRDLLTGYSGAELRPAPGVPVYRDHARALAQRDTTAVRNRWVTALAGVAGPCRVVPDDPDRPLVEPDRLTELLSTEQTAELVEFARRNDLTVNTIVQVAWAGVLAWHLGRDDVLFGATVSTRPAAHPDADQLVGLFLNTLPVRVRLDPDEPVISQLQRLQRLQAELRSDADLPLSEIVAGHPTLGDGGEPFDTTVVFENFPAPPETANGTLPFAVRSVSVWDARHHPLSVVVIPGRQLLLRIDYQHNAVSKELADGFRSRLVIALAAIAAGGLPRFSRSAQTPAGRTDAVDKPRSEVADPAVESAVISAFRSVLGRDDVDRETNFFLFGGDSIAAIHVVARLREQGIVVTPRDVFGRRTPAAIAAVCRLSTVADDIPDPFQLTNDELDLLDDELGVNL